MSYSEERMYTAKVRLDYARDGFRTSVRKTAEALVNNIDFPKDVEAIARALILDKQVLDEAQAHYDFIMSEYGKEGSK